MGNVIEPPRSLGGVLGASDYVRGKKSKQSRCNYYCPQRHEEKESCSRLQYPSHRDKDVVQRRKLQ